eukprot:15180773-Alexandrium_andersonii.AAC.1
MIRQCQESLHAWGAANRVTFDPGKESARFLGHRGAVGPDFKILGVLFDNQLLMHAAVHGIVTDSGWKL